MKKKVNPLLTSLLAGTMLLGSVSVAAAASSVPAGAVQPTSTQQQVKVSQPAPQNNKQNSPVIKTTINRAQLSTILRKLADKGIINRVQANTILNKLALNRNNTITQDQLYKQLKQLVANGTISQAQMNAIVSSLPVYVTPNKAQKDQKAPQQPTNTNQPSTKG